DLAVLGRERHDRSAPVAVGEDGASVDLDDAPRHDTASINAGRCGSNASRQQVQVCASRTTDIHAVYRWYISASATASLFARFSSADPHVIATGIGRVTSTPRSTVPTKRVMRRYLGKSRSCLSKRCRKKLPDCRSSPSKLFGWRTCACSI